MGQSTLKYHALGQTWKWGIMQPRAICSPNFAYRFLAGWGTGCLLGACWLTQCWGTLYPSQPFPQHIEPSWELGEAGGIGNLPETVQYVSQKSAYAGAYTAAEICVRNLWCCKHIPLCSWTWSLSLLCWLWYFKPMFRIFLNTNSAFRFHSLKCD